MVNAVSLKQYLVFVVLNYGILIEITVLTSKFFKHSQNKMVTHIICGVLLTTFGILNEYSNDGVLTKIGLEQGKGYLLYGLFVLNFYFVLILQISKPFSNHIFLTNFFKFTGFLCGERREKETKESKHTGSSSVTVILVCLSTQ